MIAAYTGNSSVRRMDVTGVAVNAGAAAPASFTNFVTPPCYYSQRYRVKPFNLQRLPRATSHPADARISRLPAHPLQTRPDTWHSISIRASTGGTLSFAAPVLFNVGSQPSSIATADFRANGLTDVVVANLVPTTQSGSVQVLFGDGKGNLTSASTVAIAE